MLLQDLFDRRYSPAIASAFQPIDSFSGQEVLDQPDFAFDDLVVRLLIRELAELGRTQEPLANLAARDIACRLHEVRTELRLADPDIIRILKLAEHSRGSALTRALGMLATSKSTAALSLDIALPLSQAIGEGWAAGRISVAGEHLVSATLRHLLGERLLRGGVASALQERDMQEPPPRLLFAAPYGEMHEIGLLAVAAVAADLGFDVVYAGPNLPALEVARLVAMEDFSAVCLAAAGPANERVETQLYQVRNLIPARVTLFAGGSGYAGIDTADMTNTRAQLSIPHFLAELEAISILTHGSQTNQP